MEALIPFLLFAAVFVSIVRGAVRSGKRALERAGETADEGPSPAELAEMLERELGISSDSEGGVRVRPVEGRFALASGGEDDAWEAFDSEDDLPDDETRLLPTLADRPRPPAPVEEAAPPVSLEPRHPAPRRSPSGQRSDAGHHAHEHAVSHDELHDRRVLRRAMILSEVLGKPKALEE